MKEILSNTHARISRTRKKETSGYVVDRIRKMKGARGTKDIVEIVISEAEFQKLPAKAQQALNALANALMDVIPLR